ncbi:uncharacterized protein PAC_03726 [Phialocephala subalpina]|uniref:UBC core domain-containing protein n=1 Tax=Phialocephala subalpina TaxID=576137 RepID=A0A1L7WM32_9HELO|nr:uncharacterized protein PAC_03726 [Phialocephala subalpina]
MSNSRDVSKQFARLGLRDEAPSSQDVKGNLRLLQKLHTKYHEVLCRSCRAPLSFGVVREHIRRWIDQAKGSQPAQISGVWVQRMPEVLFGIYILLSRFDEVELLLQQGAVEKARENTSRSSGDKGIGYNQESLWSGRSSYGLATVHIKHPEPRRENGQPTPILVKLLIEERPDKKQSPGLHFIDDSRQRPAFNFDSSEAAKDFKSDNSQDSIAICKQLVNFYKIIEQNAPETVCKITSVNKDPWMVFTEKNRVAFTEDVLSGHHYHDCIRKLRSSRPGRMAALSQEIASLTSSLPPGIFLKISESRPDEMKVLIISVEGTPYEGGLFRFNISLPGEWPVLLPKVDFVGDEESRDGLNPNLHWDDGKVCFSLINTWNGSPEEAWQANRSTLLSVFVSIQAMILGATEPADNEPNHFGRGSFSERRFTRQRAEAQVVRFTILYWLKSSSA